ncbi:MAG TPA: MFS transporter [Micromonosporaceae bacterium]|nr:MFS transporter [Micromonosporaceae bacterium]
MSTPTPVRLPLLGLAYLGFISLGLPDGLLGVGWPSIRTDLGVPTEAVGVLLAVFTAGYLLSSVSAGFAIARLGVGRLLAGSTAAASLALTGYAAAPWLAMMVGCAVLLGLGSGAIDSGLNAYAAGSFGARHMNWLHASFGLGATIGPVVMTSVLAAGLSWRWGYGVVAGGQALLAVAFAGSAGRWALRGTDRPAESRGPRPTVRATLSLPAVWLGAAAFAVYTAIEVAAGLWAYLLLTEGRGVSGPVAGVCVAAYWGSLFAGRLVLGMVAERLGSRRVLAVSLAGIAGGALLIAVPAPAAAAVAGLVLIGGAAAPVFPLLMLTTSDRVGQRHADRAVGVQVGAAALGGAVLPATIGVLMARFGVETLGPALLVLASLLLATYLAPALRRATVDPGRARRAGDPPTGRV